MKTRRLGHTEVSAIGLGCMNVSWKGRAATDPVRRRESAIPGFHRALDEGITLLDTANIYAPTWDQIGHNEIVVREAFDSWSGSAESKAKVVLATKGGITRSVGEVWGHTGSDDSAKWEDSQFDCSLGLRRRRNGEQVCVVTGFPSQPSRHGN